MNQNRVILIGFPQATIMSDIKNYAIKDSKEVEFLHPEEFLKNGSDKTVPHMCCITLDLNLRREVIEKLESEQYSLWTYIHPYAEIAVGATIGPGTFIGPFAMVGTNAVVEPHCNMGPYSCICHGATLGLGSLLMVAAAVAGSSHIGKYSRLSLRSTVVDHIDICDFVEIGSGALVTKDITETGKYLGSPARKIPTPYACKVPPARLRGKTYDVPSDPLGDKDD